MQRVRMRWLGWMIGLAPAALAAEPAVAPRPTPPPSTSYALLAQALARRVEQTDWGGGRVAILVKDAQLPITVFAYDDETPMRPCELVQMVTAAAALDVLGPEHRSATEVHLAGRQEGDRWLGAVILRGRGDTTLSGRCSSAGSQGVDHALAVFDDWARRLRARGIRAIEGPVIGDGMQFPDRPYPPGWPLERLGDSRLPPVSALAFNHNCIEIQWRGRWFAGRPAAYTLWPELGDFVFFANNVRTVRNADGRIRYERAAGSNVINAIGTLAPRSRAVGWATIDDPERYAAEVFRTRLERAGVRVLGGTAAARTLKPEARPAEAERFAEHLSPPLRERLAAMIENNLTLDAETLFLELGMRAHPELTQGTWNAGAEAMSRWLNGRLVGSRGRVLVDGSGQSQLDRLAALHVMQLMEAMREHPLGEVWRNLFPRADATSDASLARRWVHPPASFFGEIDSPTTGTRAAPAAVALAGPLPLRALTGSAPGCAALAGWFEPRAGRPLAVVVMVNDSKLGDAQLAAAVDGLVWTLATAGDAP